MRMEDDVRVKRSIGAGAIALGAAVAGLGAPVSVAQETPLAGIYACAEVAADDERLACFDRATAELRSDEEEGAVAVVTSEQLETAAEESFGRPGGADLAAVAPKVAAASEARAKSIAEAPDELKMTVVKIEEQRDGKIWLTMENGQVWRQTTGGRARYRGNGPWQAEVWEGAIGGYRLKLDDGRPIRVTRVE